MPARLVRPPGQHLGHNPQTPAPRRLVSGAPAPARAAPTPPRAAAADGPSADTAAAVAKYILPIQEKKNQWLGGFLCTLSYVIKVSLQEFFWLVLFTTVTQKRKVWRLIVQQ